jgi:mycothiol synthase
MAESGATHIRPYLPEDSQAIHDVALRAAEHDQVDPLSTLEAIPTLEELVGSLETNHTNPNTDIFVAVDDETNDIVGYGQVGWWREDDGTFLYLHRGHVNPNRRKQGIGSSLLEQLQGRIREIAEGHPSDAPKMLGANASETETDTLKLINKQGYSQVWSSLEMEFTDFSKVEGITLPDGYELKTVETEEDKRKVYDANKQVYRGTWGDTPPSEEDYQTFLKQSPDASLWRVAWHGDEIAGFVLSNVDKGRAEVTQVAVLPDFRRQGLGRSLMAENLKALHGRGLDIVRLHTDADGKMGGRQLYDNLGFSALKEHYRI